MINIGFLIMNFSKGAGTERVTSIIANDLSKLGYNVSIISCYDGLNPKFDISSKIKIFSLESKKNTNALKRKIQNTKKIKNIIKNEKIDIMIAVDVALYLYLIGIQKEKLCKCIAWEHFNFYTRQNFFSKISRKLAVKNADKLIVLGKNDYDNYKIHNPKINNLDYIYNPITMHTEKSTKLNDKRIIAVGRLEKQKGFDYLIDIWNKLEKEFPDWRVDIFGDGSQKDELNNKISGYNLKNLKINHFTGNIQQELLNSSIFVLTSRYEGFGLVLLEAQACGLPCVSFNCKEGPAEIISNDVNGYLIECYDEEMFAEKLKTLMSNPEKLKDFSSKSKKDLDRFDRKNVIRKWDKILKEVYNQNNNFKGEPK